MKVNGSVTTHGPISRNHVPCHAWSALFRIDGPDGPQQSHGEEREFQRGRRDGREDGEVRQWEGEQGQEYARGRREVVGHEEEAQVDRVEDGGEQRQDVEDDDFEADALVDLLSSFRQSRVFTTTAAV